MAPGSGFGFIGIEAEVVHLVGDCQPGAQGGVGPLLLQPVAVACGALIAEQQAMPAGVGGQLGVAQAVVPLAQVEPQPGRRLLPLAADRGAVAEHHKPLQPPFPPQLLEAQQSTEGLAGARAGVDQHVGAAAAGLAEPGPQQLGELALPQPRLQPLGWHRRFGARGLEAERRPGPLHGRHCGPRRRLERLACRRRIYGSIPTNVSKGLPFRHVRPPNRASV